MARISINKEKIAEFCRRHHIRRLSLFGSVLRDDFGPASDVDVLVEFEPGHDAIDYEILWHILNRDWPELVFSLERILGTDIK